MAVGCQLLFLYELERQIRHSDRIFNARHLSMRHFDSSNCQRRGKGMAAAKAFYAFFGDYGQFSHSLSLQISRLRRREPERAVGQTQYYAD